MIHFLERPATPQEIQEMLHVYETYVKLAVDVARDLLAGGGEFHADCGAALLEKGSRQEDVWGADWYPKDKKIRFGALINIRPGHQAKELEDPEVRRKMEGIIRRILEGR